MALFQNSVLNKYIKLQDQQAVEKTYKKYTKYFHNTERQQNIRDSKEEQFQEGFLTQLFVNVLGYTLNPEPNFNLTTELKNEKNAKKTDGAILKNGQALAVIELKSTKTKDLESIRQQAFDYKANQTGCVYVITSNFEKIRFYINNAVDFEEFNLFTLNLERFTLMYLCLHQSNLLNNIPLKIKTASVVEEEKITKTFYNDYSVFKRELFRDLVKQNMKNEVFRAEIQSEDSEQANKNIKLVLFKTSQKLIDRFLFIFFAEDRGLLPPNSTLQILKKWKSDVDFGDERPLYNLFKTYFHFLDTGRKGTDSRAEIFAYNGGLFKPDAILDSLLIDDELLYKHTKQLSDYDFDSQVDVNILGHIFENSLNEIESVNAEIEGTDFDKQKTKRKKDGVFYTPKYITKYIVDNTIGKLCTEKKDELNILEEDFNPKRQKETKKKLLASLETYREWLLQLTICDPACGSGAFLNQALDFLIKEHQDIDELQTNLLGGGLVFPNIENTVLENNIFGVDLNEESVEIAKLSLWLRTAQPRRKLNTLNNNIKCGNSLIDSKIVAGDKAFIWEEEFPHIFEKEPKQLYLVTFVTHNSRISDRMVEFNPPEFIKELQPFTFDGEDYAKMIELIGKGIQKYDIPTVSFTVIPDHVHLLCAADNETALNEQIRKLKGFTSYEFQRYKKWGKGENKVWAQKFNRKLVSLDGSHVENVVDYINKNVPKHSERWGQTIIDKGLKPLAVLNNKICLPYEKAIENKGGFDVVVGNPPYVRQELLGSIQKEYYSKKYSEVYNGVADLYVYFYSLSISILKDDGVLGFITPNKWMERKYGDELRRFLKKFSINKIVNYGELKIFEDASTEPAIITLSKIYSDNKINYCGVKSLVEAQIQNYHFESFEKQNLDSKIWRFTNPIISSVLTKFKDTKKTLHDYTNGGCFRGVLTGLNEAFIISKEKRDYLVNKSPKSTEVLKKMVEDDDLGRWHLNYSGRHMVATEYDLNIPEKYPIVYDYLNEFEEKLRKRQDKGKNYWNLRSCDYYPEMSKPKLIYYHTAVNHNFHFDRDGYYISANCYFIAGSDEYLQCILNSRLFGMVKKYMFPAFGDSENGGRVRLDANKMNVLPIKEVEDDIKNKFKEHSIKITIDSRNFEDIRIKFLKYLQSQFSIEKLPKKLQNWHELDFSDFIKELNKAIKKVGGEKLTKTDEMDWMDVFETKKAAAQTLKTEIDKTDAEIDKMVYELYGLSEEEIKIVEGE